MLIKSQFMIIREMVMILDVIMQMKSDIVTIK